MAGRIKGAARPKPGPKTEVVRVTTTTKQMFVVLSTKVFGQQIHFHGGRSHECVADKRACEKCELGWPVKWKGYLHCVSRANGHPCFVELTPTLSEMFDNLVSDEETFRGLVVEIWKSAGGAKGRYYVNRLSQVVNEKSLLPEEDPYPILSYLWTCKSKPSPKA